MSSSAVYSHSQALGNSKAEHCCIFQPNSPIDDPILRHSDMKEEQGAALDSLLMEETCLQQALELLNSLIPSSHSIRCFPGKWRSIRDKLEQLLSGLTAVADSNCFSNNSESDALLKSMLSTLNDISLLLHRCSDESYHGGKLLMRSDLDVVTSRLVLHNKNFTEMYASANVMHSQAIILSKPKDTASREEMRFYVKDLFSRLKIGDATMRIQALAALHEILCEDEKYVRIITIEIADAMAILVSFLELGDGGVQEGAAGVLSVIAELDSYKGALVIAGAIAPLIQILEKGTELGKERAARILRQLTEKSDNGWSVSAHGGIRVLLKICSNVDSGKELIGLACQILGNLCSVEEIRRFLAGEGAVSVLIRLSRSKEEVYRIQAIETLQAMASEDDSIRQNVVREGVMDSLTQLLDPSSPYSSKAREVALRATELFCFSSANSLNFLLRSCFLDRLLFFLKNGEISVQESAMKTVSFLCEKSEEFRKAMGDAGILQELVRLLEAKSFQVREKAAEMIYSMILVRRNRRSFIQDEQNVNQIMRLLDPAEEKSVTKKLLVSVLKLLADSKSGRKKMKASGCVHYLERLAEDNELDAKKVMKKISGNRFRSILNRIWSY